MASPDDPAASPAFSPDALSLLTRDHRLTEELFAEFARAAPQQLDPLARRICKMLRVHAQIEQELLYPAARRALEDAEILDRAEREHAAMHELIEHIESITSDAPDFTDRVGVLASQVGQHVAEEEQELFPRMRRTTLDLLALGIALAERRDTLLDVFGLHDDDEEGAANQRETRATTSGASPAARAARRPPPPA